MNLKHFTFEWPGDHHRVEASSDWCEHRNLILKFLENWMSNVQYLPRPEACAVVDQLRDPQGVMQLHSPNLVAINVTGLLNAQGNAVRNITGEFRLNDNSKIVLEESDTPQCMYLLGVLRDTFPPMLSEDHIKPGGTYWSYGLCVTPATQVEQIPGSPAEFRKQGALLLGLDCFRDPSDGFSFQPSRRLYEDSGALEALGNLTHLAANITRAAVEGGAPLHKQRVNCKDVNDPYGYNAPLGDTNGDIITLEETNNEN